LSVYTEYGIVLTMEHFDVIIVGAGLSGIGAGYHLQANSPRKTYAILEGRDAIGGTWDIFRYPGIRSDSDMYTLGYSFKPWREAKAIDPQICARHGVRKRHRQENPLRTHGEARVVGFEHRALDGGSRSRRRETDRAAHLQLPFHVQRLLLLCRRLRS
jgi:cation diffusion facilitator CzcD-associated flavoprotein CzcO